MAQWTECWPVNQTVASSIPSQGTCLGLGQVPGRGCVRSNHTLMFLSLSFSLPSPLKLNKIFKKIISLCVAICGILQSTLSLWDSLGCCITAVLHSFWLLHCILTCEYETVKSLLLMNSVLRDEAQPTAPHGSGRNPYNFINQCHPHKLSKIYKI